MRKTVPRGLENVPRPKFQCCLRTNLRSVRITLGAIHKGCPAKLWIFRPPSPPPCPALSELVTHPPSLGHPPCLAKTHATLYMSRV